MACRRGRKGEGLIGNPSVFSYALTRAQKQHGPVENAHAKHTITYCAVHKTVERLRYIVIPERQEAHLDDNLVIVPLLSV